MHVVQALVGLNVGGSELVATELSEYLAVHGHRVTIVARDGPIGDRARACGAEHLDWPIGKKRLSTLRYIKRLAEWFSRERPDIVHVHSRLPAWICWRALKRVDPAIRPLFLTSMHGHYSVSAYSSIMARGVRTIAVSERIRQYTLDNYPAVRAEDIVTIHGGASRSAFPYGYRPPESWRQQTLAEFPELSGKRWLLLPGRVTRYKGHVDFFHLVGALAADYPDVHGLFVGSCKPGSRYQAELETLADKMGIAARMTFTGDRLDIREWMAASEVVYNLSNDPPEAFGRTVLEALRLGRPTIGWDHGGVAEILAGMFPEGALEPLDFDGLERKTRVFLDHPPCVEDRPVFTLEESMSRHLELYTELTESRK